MRLKSLSGLRTAVLFALLATGEFAVANDANSSQHLPKVLVAKDGRTFVTEAGKPFVPFGVNYYRPGTGWAPQVWKQFQPEATRQDFARMKAFGVNCVRVFLTFGSFYTEHGVLRPEGPRAHRVRPADLLQPW